MSDSCMKTKKTQTRTSSIVSAMRRLLRLDATIVENPVESLPNSSIQAKLALVPALDQSSNHGMSARQSGAQSGTIDPNRITRLFDSSPLVAIERQIYLHRKAWSFPR